MRAGAILAALALLGLTPTALAASVSGELSFSRETYPLGDLGVSVGEGAMDLSEVALAGAPITIRWSSARGYERSYDWTSASSPAGNHRTTLEPKDTPLSFGPAEMGRFACGERCLVFLVSTPEGSLSLSGLGAGPIGWVTTQTSYWAGTSGKSDANFLYVAPTGWMRAVGTEASPAGTLVADAVGAGSGKLILVMFNASADLSTAGRSQTLDTRTSYEMATPGGLPLAAGQVRQSYVYLDLTDALVAVPDASSATLVGPRATLAIGGTLDAASATGELVIDGEKVTLTQAPLRIDGALALDASIELLRLDATGKGESLLSVGPRGDLSGSSTYVTIRGAAVHDETASLAALVTATALTLLILLLAKGAYSALFSRIERRDVLDNPTRAGIYASVRETPGRRASELVRSLGLLRVVVDHHLRVLIAHGFVTTREKRYFPVGEAPTAEDAAARVALEDRTRFALAQAIRNGGSRTQKELAASLGLSVRLVSHHLKRLEAHALIRREGSRPTRYVPTELLERELVSLVVIPFHNVEVAS